MKTNIQWKVAALRREADAKVRDLIDRARENASVRYSCARHGWAAIGAPCPECAKGDAPDRCAKHGWMAYRVPCPDCVKGKP